ADVLGQGTTENDISVMKHELDMLSGSGIGFEGIYYIQDVGSKVKGKIYLDKTQEGIWKCLNTTTSINNTSDFERIDATTLDDKLRNLCSITKHGDLTLYKYNDNTFELVGYCVIGTTVAPNTYFTSTITLPINVYGNNDNDMNKNTYVQLSYWGGEEAYFTYSHWIRTNNTVQISAKNLGSRSTSGASKIYIRGILK
ncbi:MAG: hypothetical protein ACRCXT_05790, partial [Paraclostridium sp.]